MPNILAQVIGYGLAEELLNLIECNKSAPDNWKGQLNASYCLGGRLKNNK